MDWSSVSTSDIIEQLRLEKEWYKELRNPVDMLVHKYSLPQTRKAWITRLKCNLFHFRINYLLLLLLTSALVLLLRPLSLLYLSLAFVGLLVQNDQFATMTHHRLLKVARLINASYAVKLRVMASNSSSVAASGMSGRRKILIVTVHRDLFSAVVGGLGVLLLLVSGTLWSLLFYFGLVLVLVALHASSRNPNLKARFNAVKEEVMGNMNPAWNNGQQDNGLHGL